MTLRNPTIVEFDKPILAILEIIAGDRPKLRKILDGVWQCPHFNFEHCVEEKLEIYPDELEQPHGVADNIDQVLNFLKLHEREEEYCVAFTELLRENEPESGGWRWHKWGDYIGTREPQCEYLAHEPEIDRVIVWHVYRFKE